jgi:MFS family permease
MHVPSTSFSRLSFPQARGTRGQTSNDRRWHDPPGDAPRRRLDYHSHPADRSAHLGSRRRGGRAGALLPAVIASLAAAPLSLFALAPNVPAFACLLGLDLFCAGLIPTVGVIAIALNMPNEIRGRAIGSYVLVSAVFGTATAPAAIAGISRALGGEAMLGQAIVFVSFPAALAAAACFFAAMRTPADTAMEGAPA